jgi:hypothetical protein
VVSQVELVGRMQDQLGKTIGRDIAEHCFAFHDKDTFESIFSFELEFWFLDLAAKGERDRRVLLSVMTQSTASLMVKEEQMRESRAYLPAIDSSMDADEMEEVEKTRDNYEPYFLSRATSVPVITSRYQSTSSVKPPRYKTQSLHSNTLQAAPAKSTDDDVSLSAQRKNWGWLRSKLNYNVPVGARYLVPTVQAAIIARFTAKHTQDHSLHLYLCYLQNMRLHPEIALIRKRKALVKAKVMSVDSNGFIVKAGFGYINNMNKWFDLSFRFEFPESIQTLREASEGFQFLTDVAQNRHERMKKAIIKAQGQNNEQLEMAPWLLPGPAYEEIACN